MRLRLSREQDSTAIAHAAVATHLIHAAAGRAEIEHLRTPMQEGCIGDQTR